MRATEFDRIVADADAFYATLEGGWAVPTEREWNAPMIRRTLRAIRSQAAISRDGDDVRN
jgi:hypothetical protein